MSTLKFSRYVNEFVQILIYTNKTESDFSSKEIISYNVSQCKHFFFDFFLSNFSFFLATLFLFDYSYI